MKNGYVKLKPAENMQIFQRTGFDSFTIREYDFLKELFPLEINEKTTLSRIWFLITEKVVEYENREKKLGKFLKMLLLRIEVFKKHHNASYKELVENSVTIVDDKDREKRVKFLKDSKIKLEGLFSYKEKNECAKVMSNAITESMSGFQVYESILTSILFINSEIEKINRLRRKYDYWFKESKNQIEDDKRKRKKVVEKAKEEAWRITQKEIRGNK